MHKAFHDELPQVLSKNIVIKRPTGYFLRASDSLTVPRFNSIYGNSIAHRGSVLWNILISNDKNFTAQVIKTWRRKFVQWTTLKSWLSKRPLQLSQILDVKISIIFRGFKVFLTLYIYVQLSDSFNFEYQ